MSGTRSPSPTAPAIEAGARSLIVAAHGDRGGLWSNRLAGKIAGMIGETGRFAHVEVGYLRGTPALREIGADLPGAEVWIYPVFMARGYYVERAIPECLGIGADGRDGRARPVHVMEPIGIRPVMARMLADRAGARAREAAMVPAEAGILLIAHGSSRDPSSREATLAIAARIEQAGGFRRVDCAFLEEPPLLDHALAALAGPLVVVGMFIGEGMHGHDDLGAAVAGAGRSDIALAPPLAGWPELAEAVRDDILAVSAE